MDPGISQDEATFRYGAISKLYNAFESCNWTIVVPMGKHIKVQFESVSLSDEDSHCNGDETDKLEIYDGGNSSTCLLGQVCGSIEPSGIYSTGNIIFLNFQRGRMHRGQCENCAATTIKVTGKMANKTT